jgi:hypothetical protein
MSNTSLFSIIRDMSGKHQRFTVDNLEDENRALRSTAHLHRLPRPRFLDLDGLQILA